MKPYSFCRKTLLIILSLVSTLTFISCQKDIPSIFKNNGNSGKPLVLVAGYESNGLLNVAKCWIDGQEVILSDGTSDASANSIFVKGNNVYIAGSDAGAVYWKNNNEIKLLSIAPFISGNSSANSIFVSGNDVYIAGIQYKDYQKYAAYWKNGTEVILDSGCIASSIFISGNDVYVSGYYGTNAVYWKNGTKIFLTDIALIFGAPGNFARANSIFVSGQDVHVAGNYSSISGGILHCMYWKNGSQFDLSSPNDFVGIGYSVFVSGSNVYIAGMAGNIYLGVLNHPVYWKNGIEIALPSSQTGVGTSSRYAANSIYVKGNDEYAAGNDDMKAVYWKNGVEVMLTDGTNSASATSIFIK